MKKIQTIHHAKKSLGLKTNIGFVRAKKALGQNFLKSISALNKIIETGEISPDDIILEIGPGKGALTNKLLEHAGTVIAVEKDRELFAYLEEKFAEEIKNKKLILIQGDCLEFDIKNYQLQTTDYKLIANIPYNITGAILKKFLTEKYQPSLMVLMVQNEVARRIVAQDKKESILSISVKAYGTPRLVMKVPARYFSPAPKVDSAIISIKNISREFFTSPQPSPGKGEGAINEEKFWELIHAGFAHKRKVLSSNLKKFLIKNNYGGNASALKNLGKKRAEDLSLEDWLEIIKD